MKTFIVLLAVLSVPAHAVYQRDLKTQNQEEEADEQGLKRCPDGTYVRGAVCKRCPDGTYVGHDSCKRGPDGRYY